MPARQARQAEEARQAEGFLQDFVVRLRIPMISDTCSNP